MREPFFVLLAMIDNINNYKINEIVSMNWNRCTWKIICFTFDKPSNSYNAHCERQDIKNGTYVVCSINELRKI